MYQREHYTAFSLIELSIVLVIMGLLVGGVVAGRALIDSSKVVSLGNELEQFSVAVNAFNLKYDAYPGDYERASVRIRSDLENGNGDGYIGYYDPDDLTSLENWTFLLKDEESKESRMFFQHLFAAGILSFNQVNGDDDNNNNILSTATERNLGFSLLSETLLASAQAEANQGGEIDMQGRIVRGYYRSKAFPQVLLVPRVDAGNAYANAINVISLVDMNALGQAVSTNTLEVAKLTAALPVKTLVKLKQKLSGEDCRSGDCLVSGSVYIRAFIPEENNGAEKGNTCLVRSGNKGELMVNHGIRIRKCALGYSLMGGSNDGQLRLKEGLAPEDMPGADASNCYRDPNTLGVAWEHEADFVPDGRSISGSCATGYSLIPGQPEPSAVCSNGIWTRVVNHCGVGCGSEPTVANAETFIAGAEHKINGFYPPNRKVTLQCKHDYFNPVNNGYTVEATCSDAAVWEYAGSCANSICSNVDAPTLANANWDTTGETQDGYMLNYTCQDGYVMFDQDTAVQDYNLSCSKGKWLTLPTKLACKANCPNAVLTNLVAHSQVNLDTTADTVSSHGTVANFTCLTPEYTLPDGLEQITSQCENGQWSSPSANACKFVGCDNSKAPVVAQADWNKTGMTLGGGILTYTCKAGYSGTVTATCNGDGTWNHTGECTAGCNWKTGINYAATHTLPWNGSAGTPGVTASTLLAGSYFGDFATSGSYIDVTCASGYTELGDGGNLAANTGGFGSKAAYYYCDKGTWKSIGRCMIAVTYASGLDPNKKVVKYYNEGQTINCGNGTLGPDPHSGIGKICTINGILVAYERQNFVVTAKPSRLQVCMMKELALANSNAASVGNVVSYKSKGQTVSLTCNAGYGYNDSSSATDNKTIIATCNGSSWSYSNNCNSTGCDLTNTSLFPTSGANYDANGWGRHDGGVNRTNGKKFVPASVWAQANCASGYYANHPSADSRYGATFNLCTGANVTNNFNGGNGFARGCIRGCAANPSLANATMGGLPAKKNNVFPQNSSVTMTCNGGYYGSNDSPTITATCNANGAWNYNGSCVRVCDRNALTLIAGSQFYQNASNPITGGTVYASKRYFSHNSAVEASCIGGYTELATGGQVANGTGGYSYSHGYYCDNGTWKTMGTCQLNSGCHEYTFTNITDIRSFSPGANVIVPVAIQTWGGQGGTSGSATGGKAGYSRGSFNLPSNYTLRIFVGGAGEKSNNNTSHRGGGYGGGGVVWSGCGSSRGTGATGGGLTAVSNIINNTGSQISSLGGEVIVVAGGGGGGAEDGNCPGGAGGGNTGGAGACYGNRTTGGSQSAGGTPADGDGRAGSAFRGGDTDYKTSKGYFCGGAGGGGWYGGASGPFGKNNRSGGGGGSGTIRGSRLVSSDSLTDFHTGDGMVRICWGNHAACNNSSSAHNGACAVN